ncbi:UDP-glucose 4-epimerase GalE [Algiphilus aromaticivorans]|uniref:UDP-glucose 4-epimerase GalE n=1 Tax=Algiphilus aromaticivorans TaxID=382454 RepID=UPI000A5386FD|nr:UDP-glucose 4-epimerase GalE [Algiphilus aromaticivorans]
MAKYLVCGGAGYIGSHMCKRLHEAGHEVVVCDDLSTGHLGALQWGLHACGSLEDAAFLRELFATHDFDGVLHFAALSVVAESMRDPQRYYGHNVAATLNLLRVMREFEVSKLVFSSTAAVFGEPLSRVIAEDHPTVPVNPYGLSKLMVEQILRDSARAYGLRAVALRYFNAAGADPSAVIGEAHDPETHLIPKLVRKAAGEGMQVTINGTDYPTEDGTCIRDYVHVNDLAEAHLLALDHLDNAVGMHTFNLGNGTGHSVKQVVDAVQEVTGVALDIPVTGRRPGDPAHLVAGSKRARAVLGWEPRYTKIADIIETAVRWHGTDSFRNWIAEASEAGDAAAETVRFDARQQQRKQG